MRTQSDIWINPITAIQLFTKSVTSKARVLEDIGEIVKDRKFKVTVEAWCAAMYLMGLEKEHPDVRHFLQQNPQDPPDFYGLDLFKEAGLLRGYVRDIEVFEYVRESTLNLIEEIKKKVNKAYSSKTILVCHIRKDFTDTIGHIHELVSDLKPRNEIWVIGGSERDVESEHLVAQVFPDMKAIRVDIAEVMQQPAKPAFIQGSTGKNSDMVFEPTGKSLLLTSEFQLKDI